IAQASLHGSLGPEEKAAVLKTIQALPEAGMNWSAAWNFDASSTQQGVESIINSKYSALAYKNLFGEPMPSTAVLPGGEMMKEFRAYMANVGEALRLPSEQSEIRIRELERDRKNINVLLQGLIPSPIRINDSRKEVQTAREFAIHALQSN
ncbi:MAG TPA: hypothetical protein VEU98_06825, partial [Candidatus Eremiobacteraceae bacterium]|nr:hypothetical protein [Candidatus Eremiobacteraceae bacterium]